MTRKKRVTVQQERQRLYDAMDALTFPEYTQRSWAYSKAFACLDELEDMGVRYVKSEECVVDIKKSKAMVDLVQLIDDATDAYSFFYHFGTGYDEQKVEELLADFCDELTDAVPYFESEHISYHQVEAYTAVMRAYLTATI